jgi:hypothetical protein
MKRKVSESRPAGPNFGARMKYLEAVQTDWPDRLASVRAEVLPAYREWRESFKNRPRPTTFAEVRASGGAHSPLLENVETAIERWAVAHGVRDEWLLDAAVAALGEISRDGAPERWTYHPRDFETPSFVHRIDATWLPGLTSWTAFKEEIDAEYNVQLSRYRETVQQLWGENKRSANAHALWTALWQKGMSPGEIRLFVGRHRRPKPNIAAIRDGVQQFARSIGLTLRPGRKGPRRREI